MDFSTNINYPIDVFFTLSSGKVFWQTSLSHPGWVEGPPGLKESDIRVVDNNGDLISLDGSRQLNLSFIKLFFKKLDFDNDMLASKLWPLWKEYNIVCDPKHKFGQPIVQDTNIQAEAIYSMYKANEPISFIADIYEITETEVKQAIRFFNNAA